MVKVRNYFLFHMSQAILHIDYLKCLRLREGLGPDVNNFRRCKSAELSGILRTNTIHTLRCGDHTFERITVILINESSNFLDQFKAMMTFIYFLVLKLLMI